jgi:hypothetical protein
MCQPGVCKYNTKGERMIDRFAGEYSFLSNFYSLPPFLSWDDGIQYPTVEHYFQAHKTLDPEARAELAAAPTAARAKALGRGVALRLDWEGVKLVVMREALEYKFCQDSHLSKLLTQTGDALLCEGNYWGDRYWGVMNGKGQNWLGHLLMARRAELRGA